MTRWPFKVTHARKLVLRALLIDPDRPMFGYEIGKATGLPSGTVLPILKSLETAGWATSHTVDNPTPGRPARRYYQLTPHGLTEAPDYSRPR